MAGECALLRAIIIRGRDFFAPRGEAASPAVGCGRGRARAGLPVAWGGRSERGGGRGEGEECSSGKQQQGCSRRGVHSTRAAATLRRPSHPVVPSPLPSPLPQVDELVGTLGKAGMADLLDLHGLLASVVDEEELPFLLRSGIIVKLRDRVYDIAQVGTGAGMVLGAARLPGAARVRCLAAGAGS